MKRFGFEKGTINPNEIGSPEAIFDKLTETLVVGSEARITASKSGEYAVSASAAIEDIVAHCIADLKERGVLKDATIEAEAEKVRQSFYDDEIAVRSRRCLE